MRGRTVVEARYCQHQNPAERLACSNVAKGHRRERIAWPWIHFASPGLWFNVWTRDALDLAN
jgi:hypothetical protein